MVQSADDAIIGKTITGIVQTWNPGAERLYGYSAEDMIDQDMTILLPPDRSDEEAFILDRIARGERVDHFDTVRRRKDGRLIKVSVAISPIRSKDGSVIGASHVARDITGGAALEFAQSRLAAIVESSDDAIISKNLSGIVQTWNKGAESVYGYSSVEMIGRPMSILLPSDLSDEEAAILERLSKGARVDHFETARMRKDGARIDVVVLSIFALHSTTRKGMSSRPPTSHGTSRSGEASKCSASIRRNSKAWACWPVASHTISITCLPAFWEMPAWSWTISLPRVPTGAFSANASRRPNGRRN